MGGADVLLPFFLHALPDGANVSRRQATFQGQQGGHVAIAENKEQELELSSVFTNSQS